MPYFQNNRLRQGYTRVNLGEGLPEIINTNKEQVYAERKGQGLIPTIANTYKASQDINPNKIVKEINDKKEEMEKLEEYKIKLKNKEQEIIDSRAKLNENEVNQIKELVKKGNGFVKF